MYRCRQLYGSKHTKRLRCLTEFIKAVWLQHYERYCELVQVTLLARSRPTFVSARFALVFPHFENLPWSAQGCLISTRKGSVRKSKEIRISINDKYLMIHTKHDSCFGTKRNIYVMFFLYM